MSPEAGNRGRVPTERIAWQATLTVLLTAAVLMLTAWN